MASEVYSLFFNEEVDYNTAISGGGVDGMCTVTFVFLFLANVNPVSSTLLLSRYRPNPAEAARPLKASGDNFVSTVTVPIAVVSSPCHKEEQECLTSHGLYLNPSLPCHAPLAIL